MSCVCVCVHLCEQEREREKAFASPEHFSGVSFACLHLMSSLKDTLLGHPAWDHEIPECLSSISPPGGTPFHTFPCSWAWFPISPQGWVCNPGLTNQSILAPWLL